MNEAENTAQDNSMPADRLSSMWQSCMRITSKLDMDEILQTVVDESRRLTGARYAALRVHGIPGVSRELITSGAAPEPPAGGAEPSLQSREVLEMSMEHQGESLGTIRLAGKAGEATFGAEDRQTLGMVAGHAAVVIANARIYREEQRAKANLDALVNISPVGVVVFDGRTADVISVNEETTRILGGVQIKGLPPERLLELMTFRRPDGRNFQFEDLPLVRVLQGGETVRAEEVVVQMENGYSVTTLVNARPIYSDGGEMVSVIATIQDITPLEDMERLRTEFLGMVSHELRTPLTIIKGSTATMLNSSAHVGPAEARQFFRIIDEQADYMRGLINDLLDVARIEAGTLSVVSEPTDPADLIEQARTGFLSSGAGNAIEVIAPPDLSRIRGDRPRLIQVLNNLLSNASKYSPEGSTIRVTAEHESSWVSITVSDQGRGIPAEQLPHLFKKFSRIDGGEDPHRIGGAGLGLAICKGIVEAHGGRMWAESAGPGLGTSFTFTIPVADPDEAIPYALADSDSPMAPLERVLAVDDDPQVLAYIRNALADAGYTPVVTVNPEEVESLIQREEPDLILLDLLLPGTSGFELMQRIPEITGAPVIFLSGQGTAQDIARALEMGAVDYIVKPFSPTELVARIQSALAKHASAGDSRPSGRFVLGDLIIDYGDRQVTLAGAPVRLTDTEYRLLFELSVNAGRVLTHDHLLRRVWGVNHPADPRPLRAFVKTLRRKLGDSPGNPKYIFTEPRVGYRMDRPPAEPAPAAAL